MVVDFHSHILPGIDDGSRSAEESLEMLRMSAAQGIRRMVATPHFYPQRDDLDRFLRRRSEAEKVIRERMEEEAHLPEISIGAEVYFFSGIGESDAVSQLTIDKKGYILLEMPQPPWSSQIYRDVENIYTKQGIVPIIAHVDRYISRFRTHGIPERLNDLPVLVQANASFFLDKRTASMALRMLSKGQIQLLGSDCHGVKHRPPRLGEAIQVIQNRIGKSALDEIWNHASSVLADN